MSSSVTFRFEYLPCFDDALTNEAAFVTLYSLPEDYVRRNRSLESATSKGECFEEQDGASKFFEKKVPIFREFDETTSTQMAVLIFEVCQIYVYILGKKANARNWDLLLYGKWSRMFYVLRIST